MNNTFKTDLTKAIEYFDKSRDRVRYWKPTKETSRIRILPSWNNDLFFREVAFHFKVGLEKRTILCPRRTPGIWEPCPVCEHLDSYRGLNTEEARKMFSSAGSKTQYLYNIIDLDNPDAGVQVYCSGRKVWNQLMTYMKDVNNWGDFTDIEKGFNITITRDGKDQYASYDVKLDRLPSPIKDLDWLNHLRDLNKDVMGQRLSYAEIKKLLDGDVRVDPPQVNAESPRFGFREPEQERPAPASQRLDEDILKTLDDDDVLADEGVAKPSSVKLTDQLREEMRSKLS